MTTTDPTIEELIDSALEPQDWPQGLPNEAVLAAIGEVGAADLRAQYADVLEAWRIDGERTALWAANKLRMAEARRAGAHKTAQELLAVAEAHVSAIERATEWDIAYFTGQLRRYHEESIAGTKRKQTPLPGGIKLKTNPGGVTTEIDETRRKELTDWLEANRAELLDYPDPAVKKADLKAAFSEAKLGDEPGEYPAVDAPTGEVVPGVTFVRKPGTFDVVLPESIVPETDDA